MAKFEIKAAPNCKEFIIFSRPDAEMIGQMIEELKDTDKETICFRFDDTVEPDFITYQFLMAVKKWMKESGRDFIVENVQLRADHPVSISAGKSLKDLGIVQNGNN